MFQYKLLEQSSTKSPNPDIIPDNNEMFQLTTCRPAPTCYCLSTSAADCNTNNATSNPYFYAAAVLPMIVRNYTDHLARIDNISGGDVAAVP